MRTSGILAICLMAVWPTTLVAQSATGGGPDADKPVVRWCTGPAGGNYRQAVDRFIKQAREKLRHELVDPTGGSLDNIDLLLNNKCDIAPVQIDALVVRSKNRPEVSSVLEQFGTLYKETVHLVCNTAANVGRVTNLRSGKFPVAIGGSGSGSSITLDAFIAADKGYSNVPTRPLAGIRAIEAAKLGNDVTCALFTSALNNPAIKEADSVSEGRLQLIPVDDGDLENAKDPKTKKPVYQYVYIPSGTYPKLQSGRVKSVQVDAIWIVRTDFIEKNPRVTDELLRAKNRAQPDILQMVGQTPQ